jgi:hypothetical protein
MDPGDLILFSSKPVARTKRPRQDVTEDELKTSQRSSANAVDDKPAIPVQAATELHIRSAGTKVEEDHDDLDVAVEVEAPDAAQQQQQADGNPTTFKALGVSEWLHTVCGSLGMKEPTKVQRGCIPAILDGRDVIGVAHTGSGKTAAFALPILQRLSADPFGVFALVLTPTRQASIAADWVCAMFFLWSWAHRDMCWWSLPSQAALSNSRCRPTRKQSTEYAANIQKHACC